MTRAVLRVVTAARQREGAGFVVRRPFPGNNLAFVDPFLLLDEMGPVAYAPGEATGAPDHPHRGFETVSYLLEGSMVHEDSAGHRGELGAGDVQWMTAGAGVVHSEVPSPAMLRDGGRAHGFQVWVNLPARLKMTDPRYQEVPAARIPVGRADGVEVRVIAGKALGVEAVIDTWTPIVYQDWRLEPGAAATQPLPADHNAMVYVFVGSLDVSGTTVQDGQLAILGGGDEVALQGGPGGGRALLLAGVPHREPVAHYGPFVMNTREELLQAVQDFQAGRLGRIVREGQA
jgi:hypothetical protein